MPPETPVTPAAEPQTGPLRPHEALELLKRARGQDDPPPVAPPADSPPPDGEVLDAGGLPDGDASLDLGPDELGEAPLAEPPAEPRYKVSIDGKDVEVPLGELLNGYTRASDYTRKTQALAQQRQEQEAARQKLEAMQANIANVLQAVQPRLEEELGPEPDWEQLATTDLVKYIHEDAKWRKARKQREAAEELQRQAVLAQQRAFAERVAAEDKKLEGHLGPEWSDPARKSNLQQRLANWARSQGYTDEDLAKLADARTLLMAVKAMRFDEARTRKQAPQPLPGEAPPLSNGQTPPASLRRAWQQFEAQPNIANGAEAWLAGRRRR